MKLKNKFITKIALLVFCVSAVSSTLYAKSFYPSSIDAKAVLLYDATDGRVLFERNSKKALAPASTVKLMTAYLVWKKLGGFNGKVRVQRSETNVTPTHVPLRRGEILSVKDLVRALLIRSANDSALALGRHTSGSVKKFVQEMNKEAKKLGCINTHFVNPNGLPARGQHVCAEDLLRIFQAAISVPEIRRICSTTGFYLDSRAGFQFLKTSNLLLGKYPGLSASKTGWTRASLHTYASSAVRDGHELHLILLKSHNKWKDAVALFDMGFNKVRGASIVRRIQSSKGDMSLSKNKKRLKRISKRKGKPITFCKRAHISQSSKPRLIELSALRRKSFEEGLHGNASLAKFLKL